MQHFSSTYFSAIYRPAGNSNAHANDHDDHANPLPNDDVLLLTPQIIFRGSKRIRLRR